MLLQDGRLSIRLSVTCQYSVEMAKSSFILEMIQDGAIVTVEGK